MLLKRLRENFPPHIADLLPKLETAGIKTTENVLFTPISTLYDKVDTIQPYLIDELRSYCLKFTAPISVAADEIYRKQKEKGKSTRWGGFGVASTDQMFDDWDGCGLIEISGPRRVGKSLLALHSGLRILATDENAICQWIDTEGSLSPDRAKAILSSWDIDPSTVLDRFIITPCFQVEPDGFEILERINSELQSHTQSSEHQSGGTRRTRVIILDTVSVLFKDNLNASSSKGHSNMISFMEDLAEMTRQYDLLTIFINTVSSSVPTNPLSAFSSTIVKPSLGLSFGYCADITLLVQETGKLFGMVDQEERDRTKNEKGLRAVVEVLKSRVSPAGRWSVIETDGTRLFDVAPPPLEDERTIRQSAGLPVGDERPRLGGLAVTLRP